jgi:ABC-type Zn uptake system ZnuABC Zn-binding protein ZnuA
VSGQRQSSVKKDTRSFVVPQIRTRQSISPNDAAVAEMIWMLGLIIRRPMATIVCKLSFVAVLLSFDSALAEPIHVVVPGRAYADLAETIAGMPISISVMAPPDSRTDGITPPPPGSLVLCSGTRADAWLRDAASRAAPGVTLIEVYRLPRDQNSYIAFPWYDLPAITDFSHAIAAELARREPASALRINANLAGLLNDFKAIKNRIDEVARDYARSDVIVADDLSRGVARQLAFKTKGLANHGQQNGSSSKAALQEAIARREGSIFLYDKNLPDRPIKELVDAATDNGIPVVALQEQLPTGLHYQRWALRQWNTIHGALNEAAP